MCMCVSLRLVDLLCDYHVETAVEFGKWYFIQLRSLPPSFILTLSPTLFGPLHLVLVAPALSSMISLPDLSLKRSLRSTIHQYVYNIVHFSNTLFPLVWNTDLHLWNTASLASKLDANRRFVVAFVFQPPWIKLARSTPTLWLWC